MNDKIRFLSFITIAKFIEIGRVNMISPEKTEFDSIIVHIAETEHQHVLEGCRKLRLYLLIETVWGKMKKYLPKHPYATET